MNLGWNPFQLPSAQGSQYNMAQKPASNNPLGFFGQIGAGLTSPLGITSMLGLGGDLFGFLGGMGARSRAKKNYQGDRGALLNMIGQDVFDPNAAAAFARRNVAGDVRQQAGYLSRFNPNMNLPEARGALFEAQNASLMPMIFNAAIQNMREKAARDMAIRSTLLGESAQRYQ